MAVTFTSGQDLTASDLNAIVKYCTIKAADESVTSSAAMQDDNDFAGIAIGAGETWRMDLFLELTGSETGDFQCDWNPSGTVTIPKRMVLAVPAAETDVAAAGTIGLQVRDFGSDVSSVVDSSATSRACHRESILVRGGASGGTVTFRWSQNTSTGTATVVKADSWLDRWRVI